MRTRLVVVATVLVLAACGGDPEIPTLMVNDLCQFNGPSSVEEGQVRFTLQRTGLGDYGAAVVRFEDGRGSADLIAHFETGSRDWDDRPDWIDVSYLLETRDEDLTPEDHRGETTLMSLGPGEHALVCINLSDGWSEVAETIEVRARDS